jgi:type VI secretion system protein ImpH
MATQGGDAVHALIEELERDPRAFSFFRAVWLLERANPGAAPVGGIGPAREEVVRLRPSSSLAFPSADVTRLERRDTEDGPRWRLTTPLLGLYGITSPLPSFYTEDILHEEARDEDDPARLLLDLVNHRLLSLLYRAWSKYRWEFTYQSEGGDKTSRMLFGWLGLLAPEQQRVLGVPAARLLRYAGDLTQRPRCASTVAGVLADWFDVPVRLEQCVARRVRIAEADRSRLGRANSAPGEDLVVGERVLDRSGKCRIDLGPLPFARYEALHPGGGDHASLGALAAFLLPDALAFDLCFRVEPATVPPLRLRRGAEALRLGWSTWLGGGPPRSDVIFTAAPARAMGAT